MNTNKMKLNMKEMERVSGGLPTDQTPKSHPLVSIGTGAVSGSGMHDGTYRPGGVMVTAIGGFMGALSGFCNWITNR